LSSTKYRVGSNFSPQTHSQQGFEANVTYKCQNLTFRHFLKTQKSSVTRLYQGLQRFVVECQNGLAPRGKISRDFSSVYASHSEKTLLCAQHPIYKYNGRVTLSPIIFISGCVGGDEKKSSSHQPKMIMFLVAQTDLAHKRDGLWVVMMASRLVAPSHTSLVGLRAVACATSNSPDG
jgi:hypothetical protein